MYVYIGYLFVVFFFPVQQLRKQYLRPKKEKHFLFFRTTFLKFRFWDALKNHQNCLSVCFKNKRYHLIKGKQFLYP